MWSFLFEPTKLERECLVSERTGGLSLGLGALTLFFWRCVMGYLVTGLLAVQLFLAFRVLYRIERFRSIWKEA